MGKKYLETKKDSLESSVLGVWKTAIEEGEAIRDAAQMTKKEVEIDEKHDTHVDPKDREELDLDVKDSAKKMKRSKEPAPNISEASGDKEAYKKFFNAALKKFKVSSPAELKGDQKKKFFDYIDKGWEGDNEKAEAAMSQVREYKIQSMKAALAQVWGMEEGKNPFKTEDHDDDEENKKKNKTDTGKKLAAIDLDPKIGDLKAQKENGSSVNDSPYSKARPTTRSGKKRGAGAAVFR